jgi:hypothetical protein
VENTESAGRFLCAFCVLWWTKKSIILRDRPPPREGGHEAPTSSIVYRPLARVEMIGAGAQRSLLRAQTEGVRQME